MAKGMLRVAVRGPRRSCDSRTIKRAPGRPQGHPKEVRETGLKEQKVPAA